VPSRALAPPFSSAQRLPYCASVPRPNTCARFCILGLSGRCRDHTWAGHRRVHHRAIWWHGPFCINIPVGAAMIALIMISLEKSRDPHVRRIDFLGALAFSSALFLVTLALIEGQSLRLEQPRDPTRVFVDGCSVPALCHCGEHTRTTDAGPHPFSGILPISGSTSPVSLLQPVS
jgi:hypothetical protein